MPHNCILFQFPRLFGTFVLGINFVLGVLFCCRVFSIKNGVDLNPGEEEKGEKEEGPFPARFSDGNPYGRCARKSATRSQRSFLVKTFHPEVVESEHS